MEVREVWRHAHLKQHLGSRDGYRTRQLGGSGLKSTTGGTRGAAPPAWIRAARTTRN